MRRCPDLYCCEQQVIPTQFVFFSITGKYAEHIQGTGTECRRLDLAIAIVGSAVLYQEFRDVTFSR